MKGDAKVIDALNQILSWELAAINQYFVHAMMRDNWGYQRLAERAHKDALSEMKHAEAMIDRILHLEGTPNVSRMEKIRIGAKVAQQLNFDLDVEVSTVPRFNTAIALAVSVGDNVTRDLLEAMLKSEDEHVHWLESQLSLIAQVGEQNYLAQQIRE